MPTYEFQCKGCTQTVSVTCSMDELKTPRCGHCETWMHRVYSIQGVRFKGSGFYTTDKKEDK